MDLSLWTYPHGLSLWAPIPMDLSLWLIPMDLSLWTYAYGPIPMAYTYGPILMAYPYGAYPYDPIPMDLSLWIYPYGLDLVCLPLYETHDLLSGSLTSPDIYDLLSYTHI